jgi:endonuclease/exonuclease/phosphatase family metal-dependent hydrolase
VEFEPKNNNLTVMSYNIRCLSPLDLGEKNWFYRADYVIDTVVNAVPGVIGFQEVTGWQYDYLCERLVDYDSILTYRDNSIASEACPIFYRKDMYTLIDKNSFWLSETPDVMSKDWGAACYRICSYVILKDKATAKKFVVFNTHLDHVSDEARINGIQVVLDKIEEFGSLPAILMGDLNAEEDSETYRSATQNFLDVKYQTSNTDSGCTYQKWGEQLDRNCIDYILISKTGFNVLAYKVVDDTYDGVYSSDHFPIFAELSFAE